MDDKQRKQFTIKNKDSEGTNYIISYYLNGYKMGYETIPCYEINAFLHSLESHGYELAQDLDCLFDKLKELQEEMNTIQAKISAALMSGNYVTKNKKEK